MPTDMVLGAETLAWLTQRSRGDKRHHLASMLMRESLLDKEVQQSTEVPVFRMLPDTHVIKIGGCSILDEGRAATFPVVEALMTLSRHAKIDHRDRGRG